MVDENLTSMMTLSGILSENFTKMGETFKTAMTEASEQAERLQSQHVILRQQIVRTALAGNDITELRDRYQELGQSINAATRESETYENALELGDKIRSIGAASRAAAAEIWRMGKAFASAMHKTNIETAKIVGLAKSFDMSTSSFQAWSGVAQEAGLEGKHLGGMVKNLSDKVIDFQKLGQKSSSASAFKTLGIKQSMLDGMDAAEQFEEVMKRLEGMDDQQQAASLANKLLGKQGSQLSNVINQSGKSVKQLLDEQRKFNLLTEEGAKGAADYSSEAGSLKTALTSAWQDIAGVIGGELVGEIKTLSATFTQFYRDNRPQIIGFFKSAIEFGRGLSAGLVSMASCVNTVVQALGGWENVGIAIASLMAGKLIAGLFSAVITVYRLVRVVGLANMAMMAFNGVMMANPIGMIAAGISLLIFMGIQLYQNWDSVTAWIGKAFAQLVSIFTSATDTISQCWGESVAYIGGCLQWLTTEFSAVRSSILSMLIWPSIEMFSQCWGESVAYIGGCLQWLKTEFSAVSSSIQSMLSWPSIEVFSECWRESVAYIGGCLQWLKTEFSAVSSSIQSLLSFDPLAQIAEHWSPITEFFEQLWGGITGIFDKGMAKITWVWDTVSDWTSLMGLSGDDEHDAYQKREASKLPTALSGRGRLAIESRYGATQGNTVNQNVGEIKVYAAPGQSPTDVARGIQAQLGGRQYSALHDLPEVG
ncbi:hypothetical protein [Vibrio ostreicida]|uniref:hypothetical protein n=1 Tax=Vibrio ostreicida TaxID=526588 RepID=UPI0009712B68|nr:hypothetical protein [Vibrio ostreicida]